MDEQGKLADMVSCAVNVECDVCVIVGVCDKMLGGMESRSG